jgi:tRNA (mo5U34)-methyltransferase
VAKRSLRWRGFALEVEVPGRAAAAAKRLVKRAKPNHSRRPLLEFPRSSPTLHVQKPQEATRQYVDELRQLEEWFPDLWSPEAPGGGDDLAATVERMSWYHTLELPGGIVTKGYYDHRPLVPHYGIPDDLAGKRVLDIGSWDGFWSFEFERRGADVTAVDLDHLTQTDLPPQIRQAVLSAGLERQFGGGFEVARRALGSKVNRIVGSVYDLDPEKLGTFDLVHFADVALHLERPLDAFRRIRSVTAGQAMIIDSYEPSLDDRSRDLTEYQGGWVGAIWWNHSLNTFAQMVIDAGFSDVRVQRTYRLNPPSAPEPGPWRAILIATP